MSYVTKAIEKVEQTQQELNEAIAQLKREIKEQHEVLANLPTLSYSNGDLQLNCTWTFVDGELTKQSTLLYPYPHSQSTTQVRLYELVWHEPLRHNTQSEYPEFKQDTIYVKTTGSRSRDIKVVRENLTEPIPSDDEIAAAIDKSERLVDAIVSLQKK